MRAHSLTRLRFRFRFHKAIYGLCVWRMCVQKFAFLGSSADIVTRQTEVVYKELHLKSTRQCSRFPFISKELHRKVLRYLIGLIENCNLKLYLILIKVMQQTIKIFGLFFLIYKLGFITKHYIF